VGNNFAANLSLILLIPLVFRGGGGDEELVAHNFCSWAFSSWRWLWENESLLWKACQETIRILLSYKMEQ